MEWKGFSVVVWIMLSVLCVGTAGLTWVTIGLLRLWRRDRSWRRAFGKPQAIAAHRRKYKWEGKA